MDILLICISFVLCLVCAFIGYKFGSNKKVEIAQLDFASKEKELAAIQKEINQNKARINSLTEEYESKKKLIQDAKQKAEDEYLVNKEKFALELAHLREKFEQEYKITSEEFAEKINILQQDLLSLQNTKAATIEALQKEKAIQEQKDLYRLNITDQEKQDIGFLKSIQYRISKPRLLAMLIWQSYYQPIAKQKFPTILGSDIVCGIYKITNTLNQMCYIGQSVDCRKRWNEHCKCGVGIDTPQGNKLYKAMQEDGLENFTFEILEKCTPEELNEKEKYYIDLYNSINFGYNGQSGVKN